MPLRAFSFPFPETRFLKAGRFIYKFKIRGGTSYRDEVMREDNFNQELENIIRTVLGNLDSLQPFSSHHYTVFPYKKRWEGLCKHSEKRLSVYPYVLILYLEKNMQNGKQTQEIEGMQEGPSISEPQSKRCRRDSPLEDAIIKDLIKDVVDESMASPTGKVGLDDQHAEVKEDSHHAYEKGTRRADNPMMKSGVSMVRGGVNPAEVHHGTTEDTGEEEEEKEEEETPGTLETPMRPGILTRMASHIFPFSLFFRDQ